MQSNQFMINIAVELDVVKTEHGPHLLQDSGFSFLFMTLSIHHNNRYSYGCSAQFILGVPQQTIWGGLCKYPV